MAVTSIWKVEGRLARVLGYAGNPDKAEGSPDEWELQGVGAAILYAADPGKTDLAKRAKAAGLDAIHDTVHEMARDEARHGKALKGLLERYFK